MDVFNKFKLLVKNYWYIALPTHAGTSAIWFGSIFFATKSGLDFVPLLEKTPIPDKYIARLKTGNVGNLAQAFIIYKLASPLRYGTTLAATMPIIKALRKRGIIKWNEEHYVYQSIFPKLSIHSVSSPIILRLSNKNRYIWHVQKQAHIKHRSWSIGSITYISYLKLLIFDQINFYPMPWIINNTTNIPYGLSSLRLTIVGCIERST